jgi:hypothetical protein
MADQWVTGERERAAANFGSQSFEERQAAAESVLPNRESPAEAGEGAAEACAT